VEENTLLLEAGEQVGAPAPAGAVARQAPFESDEPHPLLRAKQRTRTCSAFAVKIPRRGVRIVTALHCAEHHAIELFDGQRRLMSRARFKSIAGLDLALLDVGRELPWEGLAMRPAANVPLGERLCAWRMLREPRGLRREKICARVIARKPRAAFEPWLVMSHPYPQGTSGSPLVDAEGRVVGVVVASDGLAGFAEPIEGLSSLASAPWRDATAVGADRTR
jgi:hypothetical protein